MTENPVLPINPDAPLILIDASSYLYRAYHALPPLTTSQGYPTGAMYGVLNMIGKLLEQYQPKRIGVVFDARGKNFRHELYPDYKANRPPMPEDLALQIEPLHEMVQALGLPLLVIPNIEADDVIGTLAHQATKAKQDTLISTGDKDMAQLVNNHITLINTMTDTLMQPETVIEKFGVRPDQIVDYLALVGDSSDNIPGIPKVGPKTAAKWLQKYGTIDHIIAHAHEIKGKVGENLRENLAQLQLSRELARIRTDCELPISVHELERQLPNFDKLKTLFETYEFKSWLNQVLRGEIPFSQKTGRKAHSETQVAQSSLDSPMSTTKDKNYETLLSAEQFQQWLERLNSVDSFAIDTETTSLDEMQATIVGISFAIATETSNQAAYLPLKHDYQDAPQQLPLDEVLAKLKPLLENPKQIKIGQNLKYDWHIFQNHGIQLQGMAYDTMLEAYCLNSTATRHNMDDLAKHYLNHQTTTFETLAGKGKKQKTFNQIQIEAATAYAAEDADITLQLHQTLYPKLQAEPKLLKVFNTIEMPLMPVLARMERQGVLLDTDYLAQQSQDLANKMQTLEQKAHLIAGSPFNLNSSKQLQEILFEQQQLPIIKKTPKGQPSTAEPVLTELAEQGYELPQLILEYRSLAKLKSTYTDSLPKQVHPKTGRVHTHYQQAIASTGRLSSTHPNLQNIPIRTEMGRRIRQAFIAPPNCLLMAADYSQIELRIMAHLSEDEGLIQAFNAGKDIHQATAAEIFAVPLETVTPEMRRSAKAVNFGLIYGMSAFGLAKQLKVSRKEAQTYIDLYFARYPKVLDYMESTKEKARQQGFVETLMGRRLYLPDIHAKNAQTRAYAERTAINAPMQGTAADIIKTAMIQVQNWIDSQPFELKMIMQVHDELVFEIAETDIEQVRPHIQHIMENALSLKVPLIVDIGIGNNWDKAH